MQAFCILRQYCCRYYIFHEITIQQRLKYVNALIKCRSDLCGATPHPAVVTNYGYRKVGTSNTGKSWLPTKSFVVFSPDCRKISLSGRPIASLTVFPKWSGVHLFVLHARYKNCLKTGGTKRSSLALSNDASTRWKWKPGRTTRTNGKGALMKPRIYLMQQKISFYIMHI